MKKESQERVQAIVCVVMVLACIILMNIIEKNL